MFVSGGGAAYDRASSQVDLELSGSEEFSPMQLPPQYLLSMTVRSAVAR